MTKPVSVSAPARVWITGWITWLSSHCLYSKSCIGLIRLRALLNNSEHQPGNWPVLRRPGPYVNQTWHAALAPILMAHGQNRKGLTHQRSVEYLSQDKITFMNVFSSHHLSSHCISLCMVLFGGESYCEAHQIDTCVRKGKMTVHNSCLCAQLYFGASHC